MADEDYIYCNNDLEVHAGDRTSYRTAGWWSTNLASEGMCNWSICGAADVRAWFSATDSYIKKKFSPHFERFKQNIEMSQGAPSLAQKQVLDEAASLLSSWENYAKYYRNGGGGPVGSSFQNGGYSWDSPGDADPKGPGVMDFLSGDTALELCREIVDFYDAAACLRDKFNETKPEGMLPEIPGYGASTKKPETPMASEGMSPMTMVAIGLGAWVVFKALSE